MLRSVRLQFRAKVLVLLVTLVIMILAVRLARGGIEYQWEVEPVCALNEPLVDDLWFDRQGRLVTVTHLDSSVSVKIWNSSCDTIGRAFSVDLLASAELPKEGARILPRYALRSSFISIKGMPKRWFPYAVSPDGMVATWAINGSLYSKSSKSPTVERVVVGSVPDIVALSFSGGRTLTLIREDGTLEHWDLVAKVKGTAGSRLSKTWTFWNQGARLAVTSLASGDIGLIDVKSPNENHILSNSIGFRNGSAMALSQRGLPAIGTKDGKVVIFAYDPNQGFVVKRWIPLPETRPVRAMAFFGKFLLIGGDFRSVFIVGRDGDGKPREVMGARNGARILALSQKYLAVSTPDEVILGELASRFKITPSGALSLTFFSITISLLSIGYNIIRDKPRAD